MELALQQIGKYKILSELGRGGMAVVYQAIDTNTGKEVALKVLPPTLASHETTLSRFIREGENAARLQHENIVQIYESGAADGYNYIAMELVHGQPLDDFIIEKGRLFTTDENIALLSEVAAGLDYAHSKGIIHRDIKPANILVSNEGQVMLADFGVARHLFVEQTMYTMAGQSVGTPAYMSPEQARGQDNIDFRADVYSFGVLAYKLFTGRTPFHSSDQLQIMRKAVMEEATPVHEIDPEIPLHISQVIQKCLSKNPQERFESAGSFMGALLRGYKPTQGDIQFGKSGSGNSSAKSKSQSGLTWYNRAIEKVRTRFDGPNVDQPNVARPNAVRPKVSHIALDKQTQGDKIVNRTLSGRHLTKSDQRTKWRTLGLLTCGVIIAGLFYGNAWFDRQTALDQLDKASAQIEERITSSEFDPVDLTKSGIDSVTEKAGTLLENSSELGASTMDAASQRASEVANTIEESASGIALPEDEIGQVVNTVWYPKHSLEKFQTAVSQRVKAATEWISKTISGDSTSES